MSEKKTTVEAEEQKFHKLDPLQPGKQVLIRTVTHYHTGLVVDVDNTARRVILVDAAWISDMGKFSDALNKGTMAEVEPMPDPVYVGLNAVVDGTIWRHPLFKAKK